MKTKQIFFALIIAAIPFLFITQSCEKIKDEINEAAAFDVPIDLPDYHFDLDSASLTKSAASINAEVVITEQSVNVNLDSILSANGVSSATLSSASFTSVVISMTDTVTFPDVNFDFMDGMRVVLSSTSDFSSETQVAHAESIPAGAKKVTLILNNPGIQSFIDNQNFYLRLYGTLGAPAPMAVIPLVLQSGIQFTVNPL